MSVRYHLLEASLLDNSSASPEFLRGSWDPQFHYIVYEDMDPYRICLESIPLKWYSLTNARFSQIVAYLCFSLLNFRSIFFYVISAKRLAILQF